MTLYASFDWDCALMQATTTSGAVKYTTQPSADKDGGGAMQWRSCVLLLALLALVAASCASAEEDSGAEATSALIASDAQVMAAYRPDAIVHPGVTATHKHCRVT